MENNFRICLSLWRTNYLPQNLKNKTYIILQLQNNYLFP